MNMSPQAVSMKGPSKPAAHSSLLAVIAVAIVAYATNDVIHELVGHGTVALLLGIKITSISSVGLQSLERSRLLSAAGSIANVLAGVISFVWLQRRKKFGRAGYLLWLLGFVNVMDGTCYLLASALLNNGDWSVVIADLNPAWAWRAAMGLVGLGLYFVFVRWAGALMTRFVELGEIGRNDLPWLTVPAYLAGGALMTLAAVFNPFSPSLILLSGVGASLGLTWGLLLTPGIVAQRTSNTRVDAQVLSSNWQWIALAAVVAILFVAVFGPGVRFA